MKKKLLLIADSGYVHIQRWAESLAKNGLDVSVFSRTDRELNGAKLIKNEVPPWRPWRMGRWLHRKRDQLRKVMKTVQPDIVDVHFPEPYSFFREDFPNTPLIVSTWGSEIIPMHEEPIEHKELKVLLLQSADVVVASSNFLAKETIRYGQLSEAKVKVQYWGVDLNQFSNPGCLPEKPTVGFFKHLLPKYGPDVLIAAMPQIVFDIPDMRLLMVGSGPMKEGLKRRAEDLKISNHIEWFGKIEYSQIPQVFSKVAISTMPSTHKSETLGVAALESQAMGVPVVASNIGGIPESVVHNSTGILVPPNNAQALADAIVTLLLDGGLRNRFAIQGRKHIEDNFDWNQTIKNKIVTYNELMAS